MEHLITPFTGMETENPILWIHKFQQIADIQGWTDNKKTAYFKAYMVGTALEWIIDVKKLGNKDRTFEAWKNINLETFNIEFLKRLEEVDNRYYTEHMAKTNYLRHMYSINSSTTKQILHDHDLDSWSLEKIIDIFKTKSENKLEIMNLLTPPSTNYGKPKAQKGNNIINMIEDLTKQISKMTAHIAQLDKPNPIPKCKNCGRYGHKTMFCRTRQSQTAPNKEKEKTQPNTLLAIKENQVQDNTLLEIKECHEKNNSLLAIDQENGITHVYTNGNPKRMRIEDILNQSYTESNNTREIIMGNNNNQEPAKQLSTETAKKQEGLNKTKQLGTTELAKKQKSKNVTSMVYPLAEQILQQPLSITLKINFRLITEGAVVLLLGLKDLQKYGAQINYQLETITLFRKDEDVTLILHSKESVSKQEVDGSSESFQVKNMILYATEKIFNEDDNNLPGIRRDDF
ncbi:hypothetical protein BB561_002972 [Smittium simulii]|uniref:CCHC-type domain-containing protein n=1 Tax=Smittium simulii TaxID=133385 RepID=A0A2T9YNH0_9FUNG|nr:hypothetical protein BB561_002972 [Smittium simulii]